jgi:hypothetical protein
LVGGRVHLKKSTYEKGIEETGYGFMLPLFKVTDTRFFICCFEYKLQ